MRYQSVMFKSGWYLTGSDRENEGPSRGRKHTQGAKEHDGEAFPRML